MQTLWGQIMSTEGKAGSFPWAISMPKIFAQSMDAVMDTPGDAMKPGTFWGSREKMIHSVGTTGAVKFIPKSN